MHFPVKILDPKLKESFDSYLFQCSLGTLALFLVLSLEGAHLSKVVIIAAIASTAFYYSSHPTAPRLLLGMFLVATPSALSLGAALPPSMGPALDEACSRM